MGVADEYVAIHRAKDSLIFEKHVLMAVLTNSVDDWLAILPPDDKAAVEKYAQQIAYWVATRDVITDEFFCRHAHLSRRDYAIEAQKLPAFERALAFARLDNKDRDYVVSALKKIATSGTKIEVFAADYPSFPRWKGTTYE